MNTSRKAIISVLVVVLLLVVFFIYKRAPNQQAAVGAHGAIKIGFIAPTTGPFSDWGESILHGMQLAIQDTHHTFNVDFEDDGCSTQKGVGIGQSMLAVENIRLIIGPGCSDVLAAIAPIADQNHALLFSTGLLPMNLLTSGHPSVMNFSSQISTEANYMAAYLGEQKINTLAFVHGTNAFGIEFESQFPGAATKYGVSVVLDEALSVDATDFRTTATKIRQANPKAVFIHEGEEQIGLLAKQLRAIGYQGRLYGYYGTESSSALSAGGSAMEGLQYTFPVNSAGNSAELQVFDKRYSDAYSNQPTATTLFVYDGMQLLDKALDTCSPSDTTCIKKFFVDLGTYHGLSGDMTFNSDGSITRPFGIKEIKNGQFVWVTKSIKL